MARLAAQTMAVIPLGRRMMLLLIATSFMDRAALLARADSQVIYTDNAQQEPPTQHGLLRRKLQADSAAKYNAVKDARADSTHILKTAGTITSNNQAVAKTVYSSKLRLVYLVGLEGSGHHYMADVLDSMCESPHIQCPKSCRLALALYPGSGNPTTVNEYVKARQTLRREMQALTAAADAMPQGKAILASFGKCRFNKTGLMSYPNHNGDWKALQYVDFRILAEEAELAGVDLRIIYLSRPARGLLISDTKHHRYGGTFMFESRCLLANADVVASTFQELDPKFTMCLDYGDIANPNQANRVAQFISSTEDASKSLANAMVKGVGNPTVLRSKHRKNDVGQTINNLLPGEELIVERLQQKLDVIEREQCRRS